MKRIAELDGVRGIAILMVLYWHYAECNLSAGASGESLGVLRPVSRMTWIGVDLFFVLSGFLIGGILIDHRGSPTYFRTFYARRLLRIVPLYALLLASYFGLQGTPIAARLPFLFADPLPTWSYPLFVQNLWMAKVGRFGPHWLDVTWSLAVEEQFYLVLPCIIVACPRRVLAFVATSAVPVALVARRLANNYQAGYTLFPCRMDALFIGVALAIAYRSPWAWAFVRRWANFCVAVAMGVTISVLATGRGWNFLYTASAFQFAGLIGIVLAQPESRLSRIVRSWPLRECGTLCYGLYLLHQPVQGVWFGVIRGGSPRLTNSTDAAIILLSLVTTFVLAKLSWAYLESPLVRYGRRFRYSDRGATVNSLTAARRNASTRTPPA